MKFYYKKVAPGVIRPIIPIKVGKDGFFVNYEVLADSGADICLFHSDIGELLGLKLENGLKKEVSGITGVKEHYYEHPIAIKVGGWEYRIRAGFFRGNPYSYGIVGQSGFFDLFLVKFDYPKEEIEIIEKKKSR